MRLVRHSPLYLYLKLYSLSVLVTVFASRPISDRLRHAQSLQQQIDRIRVAAQEALGRQQQAYAAKFDLGRRISDTRKSASERRSDATATEAPVLVERKRHPFPYALKTLSLDADSHFPAIPLRGTFHRLSRVFQRWRRRFRDLSMVKRTVRKERQDVQRFPELQRQAHVRSSHKAHADEGAFIGARSRRIASDQSLLRQLGIDEGAASVHPDDIPRIAVGGSGGGYRATFGFLACLQGLHRAKVYDGVFWLAGVSGSCWTIASLYTVAHHRQGDPNEAMKHYKRVAAEALHPMSRGALDIVARSPKGVHFLLNPLLSKLHDGNVGIGVMDMYATLTTSYQLLSRSPHARPRLSRSMFEFSKVWERAGVAHGNAPMPILTAVRRMPREVQMTHRDDHSSPGVATTAALVRRRESVTEPSAKAAENFSVQNYQWWEMNPLEVGSSDEGAWVPTWSYGRGFVSGQSVSTAPEISLSLLLGQATSAPAGPLTGYITTLLATLPQGTLMSKMLGRLNDFVRHKRWEKRWGNPIRGADEANPLYGFGDRAVEGEDGGQNNVAWEGQGRFKLMDSGLSNNLPNHIFTTRARKADIIVSFDQSSDVQTGAALARLSEFAAQRNIYLERDEVLNDTIVKHSEEGPIRRTFRGKYAQVFRGWTLDKTDDEGSGASLRPGLAESSQSGLDSVKRSSLSSPDLYLIYCPLLPHDCQADFDPVKADFSTSYNLVWKPDEIETLAKTANATTIDYVVPVLRQVYQHVYHSKKEARKREEGETAAR